MSRSRLGRLRFPGRQLAQAALLTATASCDGAHNAHPRDQTVELTRASASTSHSNAGPSLGHIVPMLRANDRRACVLRSNGELRCWGDAFSNWASRPTAVSGLKGVAIGFSGTSVLVEDREHTIVVSRPDALLDDARAFEPRPSLKSVAASCDSGTCCQIEGGAVMCAGSNSWNRLGSDGPERPTAEAVPGVSGAQTVSVGSDNVCILDRANDVICWGSNQDGGLGNGPTKKDRAGPAKVSALSNVAQVAVGYQATCARTKEGKILCWGNNSFGRLGREKPRQSDTPLEVLGVPPAIDLSFDSNHACIVAKNGHVWCWGFAEYGQLGNGLTTRSPTPVEVVGIDDAVGVATGSNFSCALRRDESVWCWGDRTNGRLGDGVSSEEPVPIEIAGLSRITAMCAQTMQTCAVDQDHVLKCWGWARPISEQRTDVVSCGESCVLLTDGTVKCHEPVKGLDKVTALSASLSEGCALKADGSIACWNGSDEKPPKVMMRGAVSLGTGNGVGCALNQRGELWCWGDVSRTASRKKPIRASGLGEIASISLDDEIGIGSGVLRQKDGKVGWWYWAMSKVDGDKLDLRVKMFPEIEHAASIHGGAENGCAVLDDGRVQCWGNNLWHQLGDGTSKPKSREPVFVKGLNDATAVMIARDHRCAIRRSGAVSCWGNNASGQLGKPFTKNQPTPVLAVPPL